MCEQLNQSISNLLISESSSTQSAFIVSNSDPENNIPLVDSQPADNEIYLQTKESIESAITTKMFISHNDWMSKSNIEKEEYAQGVIVKINMKKAPSKKASTKTVKSPLIIPKVYYPKKVYFKTLC